MPSMLCILCRGRYVTLINFSLSKHLIREDELLTDQCGSLAYVSPEVLSGMFDLIGTST